MPADDIRVSSGFWRMQKPGNEGAAPGPAGLKLKLLSNLFDAREQAAAMGIVLADNEGYSSVAHLHTSPQVPLAGFEVEQLFYTDVPIADSGTGSLAAPAVGRFGNQMASGANTRAERKFLPERFQLLT